MFSRGQNKGFAACLRVVVRPRFCSFCLLVGSKPLCLIHLDQTTLTVSCWDGIITAFFVKRIGIFGMEKVEKLGYFKGEWGPLEAMKVPFLDRSSFYGDGVYDSTMTQKALFCMSRNTLIVFIAAPSL